MRKWRLNLRFSRRSIERVKFYSLAETGAEFGSEVEFVRRPFHPKDSNCVEVRAKVKGKYKKLGHLAAEWLSPMLLGPFCIYG